MAIPTTASPVPVEWFWIGVSGLSALTGHRLLVAAFRWGRASDLAPLGYLTLVWSFIVGTLLFGEALVPRAVVGAVAIAAGGIMALRGVPPGQDVPTPLVDYGDPAYHRHMTDDALTDDLRAFLGDLNFATIATLDPDGAPRQAVIWYTLADDHLVINSTIGRRWPANLLRDPRISVSITDHRDGYRWIGFTGRVTPVRDQPTAQADIAAMARRYHADDPDEAERLIRGRFERQERISFRVPIAAIHDHRD